MRPDRRRTYFLFQGLLMAVLLLLYSYNAPQSPVWVPRFWVLLTLLTGSLAYIHLAPERLLVTWWAQMSLFAGDAALASMTLLWSSPASDLYLIYFLILFGTALTRNLRYSLVVAATTSVLYLASNWLPGRGFPHTSEFWLRLQFFWVTTCLLAILAQDTAQAQEEQERRYRDRLVQVESLATIGQLAGEVAHRIKAPLTTIMVNAEVVSHRMADSADSLRELKQIQEEVTHCKEILKNLLDLGRIEEMDFAEVDLRECLRSALRSLEPQLRKNDIRVQLAALGKPLPVRGDASMLHEALLAVLQNALDASSKSGRIEVSVATGSTRPWWRPFGPGLEEHVVTVSDEGSGIAREHLRDVFKPFFTTKGGGGTGLGLSAALRIAQKHGGGIEANSDGPGCGAAVTLRVPSFPTLSRCPAARAGRSA
ncbi:MAG: hypothetical protein HYZ75_04825 [Elusimicrobia bacterium]|nr:hypothetical protein [Elusimicrobiota bacterium]